MAGTEARSSVRSLVTLVTEVSGCFSVRITNQKRAFHLYNVITNLYHGQGLSRKVEGYCAGQEILRSLKQKVHHIRVQKTLLLEPASSQSTPLQPISLKLIYAYVFHTIFFSNNLIYISHITMCATCPAHLIFLDLITIIKFSEECKL